MDNNTGLANLLLKRDSLYKELLICSELQKNLVISNKEETEIALQLTALSDQWNRTSGEVDEVQKLITSYATTQDEMKNESILSILKEIQGNVEFVDHKIREFSNETGAGLQNVKNHKKVMNAYYHLESRNKDQIPLYFDQKK